MSAAFEPRRFGAYTLEARLGHGGMAEVFSAKREGVAGFARSCVVKRILGHHNDDPSFVDMFINEAKIAAKLTHPNIVQVYELGQVDGEFFIAMEYVKGRDMLRTLREMALTRSDDPAIPPSLAAYIARETCRALQHAHDHIEDDGTPRPIIHRDISPQNIMVSFDGSVKLVDFGIAKALGSMREETRTGALKGKFAYMAPEQISGQNPGPTADVFATGVVLHEMLTGRRLFKGGNDYETLNKVRTMQVATPSSIDPRIPPELDAIVLKALERDRDKRYTRASQMARELDSYLQTVRFSVEEMSDFMRELFPPEPVDQSGNQNGSPNPSTSQNDYASLEVNSSNGTKVARRPSSLNGMDPLAHDPPTVESTARTDITPTESIGGRRLFAYVGAAAILFGLAVGVLFWRREPVQPRVTAATSLPAALGATPVSPVAAPAPGANGSRHPEVTQLPQDETRSVLVRSEPSGARVFEGPRLVGHAPQEITLPADSPGVMLTLVREGRADLSYLVRPSDSPEVTLRLQPLAPSSGLAPFETGRPSGTTKSSGRGGGAAKTTAKVEPPVDSTPKTTMPRVEALPD